MTGAIGAMPTMGRLLATSRLATSRKAFASLLALATWLLLGLANAHAGNTVTKVTLVMTDTQGNVLMTKDTHGHILARYTYRPYGTQQSGPTNKGPGYTGHVNDPATGLVYMQQRYYDPNIGRFPSPDPIGPTPGNIYSFNRYAYANDNPLRYIDPDGRCAKYGNAEALCKQERKQRQENAWVRAFGGSVTVFQQHARRHGFHRYENTTTYVKSIKNIDYKNWLLSKMVGPGQIFSVDSLRIIVKPTSIAGPLSTNQYRFYISHGMLDANGGLIPSVSAPNWVKQHYVSSGLTGGGRNSGIEFVARPGPGGTRWFIKLPSQESAHGNSGSTIMFIYTPSSH